MTNDELEQRLRAWYGGEVGEDETAPSALRDAVMAIPASMPRARRRFGRRGSFPLLAAAALLVGGGALAGGAALLRLTTLVPPAPSDIALESPAPSSVPPPSAAPTAKPALRNGDLIAFTKPVQKVRTCQFQDVFVSRAACLDRRDGRPRCARAVHRWHGRPGRPGLVARRVAPPVLRQREGVRGGSGRPRASRRRGRLRPDAAGVLVPDRSRRGDLERRRQDRVRPRVDRRDGIVRPDIDRDARSRERSAHASSRRPCRPAAPGPAGRRTARRSCSRDTGRRTTTALSRRSSTPSSSSMPTARTSVRSRPRRLPR